MGVCNVVSAVQFVQQFRQEAKQLAQMLNVPIENVLGLAAHESQYGQVRIAQEDNNYFSMHAPAPLQIGEDTAKGNAHVKVAKFASFAQSGQSFIARYGSMVRGKSDPMDFAQALVAARFNSGNPKNGGAADYAKKVAAMIQMVKLRLECK
jgi:flagellum-specific peptidoglycan hydrolase FlgJ